MLGKSVISERHPLFVGIYEGAMGREEVTQFVEESDCVILLGAFMTDINMGIFTANLDPAQCIYATSEPLRISHHHYHDVLLGDFINGLVRRGPESRRRGRFPARCIPTCSAYQLDAAKPITIRRLIARLNQPLDDHDGRDCRPGRRPVRLQRTGDSPPDGVHQPGVLHVDGLCRAGGAWGLMVARPDARGWCWWATGPFK